MVQTFYFNKNFEKIEHSLPSHFQAVFVEGSCPGPPRAVFLKGSCSGPLGAVFDEGHAQDPYEQFFLEEVLLRTPDFLQKKNKQLIRNNFCGVPHSYDIRNDSQAYFEERREKLSFKKREVENAPGPLSRNIRIRGKQAFDFDEDRCIQSQRDPFATKRQAQRV